MEEQEENAEQPRGDAEVGSQAAADAAENPVLPPEDAL
jgi:hypothetical protein